VSRRELFGSLCVMVALVNLARVVFAPLVQPVAADLGVTPAALGVVATAAWLGSAAPRLPTGYLLTRVPRHRVVTATGLLLVVTSAATAFAPTLAWLTVGAFLMGISSGMYFIAANPLVAELYPERVGWAVGVHGMASQVAAVGAPLAVGAILLVSDWRATFLALSAVALATTVVMAVAARRTPLPDAGAADRSLLVAARAQWRIILTGVVIVGVSGFLWNGLFNLYGPFLAAEQGFDEATGRFLLSLTFAAGVPSFLLAGRLADRVPNVPLLLAIIGGFAVSVVGLTLVEGLLAVAALSVVVGLVVHALFPVIDTYMLASIPDEHRASAYALFSAGMMLAQSLGSGGVGWLVASGVSYAAAYQGLAAVVGLTTVGLFALYVAGRLPAGGQPGQTPSQSG
jgi:MFS family permease